MLGPYGETLVLDWGLAKEIGTREEISPDGQPPALSPGSGAPSAASGHEPTETGLVLGTAVYMSPEQAAGRGDLVGPATDVYSLGATLYVLLTGQPPFQGSQVGQTLDKVKRGQFPPPRQQNNNVPHALEAICLKAMAREPKQRYATALDIAADL